ncbi:hypothetical protein EY643_15250 [Halioglobus maricola]|uniref:P/Homo B domain-containing protein n=1 Tax=Halioglobus maricola TaxID=2601894 RepID=A0A5P9NN31_9GAMM|nr:hypothetical protein [Halioglobus maricola]QFU76896.1 hypothetical protein EY643_15250 [Halioglobus maricola]
MKLLHSARLSVPALLFALGLSATSYAAPFDIVGPAQDDVDTEAVAPTIINFNVAEVGEISSLSLRLSFEDVGDNGCDCWDNLFVQLSHAGQDVVIMDLQSDDGPAPLSATFTDGGAVLTTSDTNGIFDPAQPLSAFVGLPLDGEWTLTIYDHDDSIAGDSTDLTASSLFGETVDVIVAAPPAPPEAVPTMSAYGLVLTVLGLMFVAVRRLRASAKRD